MTEPLPAIDQGDVAKQLDVLLGDEAKPQSVTITTLDGKFRTFPVETFSNYKTAQVLKMLASIKDRVNVIELIGEVMQLAQPGEVLLCPHCKARHTPEDPVLDAETGRVGCNACGLDYHLKDAIRDTSAQVNRVQAAFSAIPKLMEIAPDLLLDFGALAVIPNRDLAKAAKKPNGIAELRQANREWLEFECDAGVGLQLLNAYISCIGMDFLAREIGKMDKAIAKLFQTLK